MRNVYLLLLLQCFFLHSKSQTPALTACDSARLDSSLDLRSAIFSNIVTTDTFSYAKNPLPSLFRDVQYKSDAYKAGICPPPAADSCLNDASALVYTVTYPKDHLYSKCALKPVVLMHAGGFAECSRYDQIIITTIATQLASKGFVVYNVEYRRGIRFDSVNLSYTSAQQHLAPYRAIQDIRGFLRSMIKRERKKSSFGDYWRVDTNNIFIGGFSAGALTALNVAWYTNSMLDSLYAPPIATGNVGYALGPPDADFYYGEPELDFHDYYQPKIKAVCSMWVAIPMPYKPYGDSTQQPYFFTNAHLTPAILFSGYQDPTFPFINRAPNFSQNVYLSPSAPASEQVYNSVSYCIRNGMGPFQVDPYADTADFVNGSSNNIYKILNYYSLNCEIYLDCQMKHGLDNNCSNPGCYKSNFGTGATNQAQTTAYMASRIAVFFQKILHPVQSVFGNTIFVECENISHNCNLNTNCTNRACNGQVLNF